MKTLLKYIAIIAFWLGLIALCSECDSIVSLLITKAIGFALVYSGAKGVEKNLTEEEAKEKA